MKKGFLALMTVGLVAFGLPAHAGPSAEEILKAIVKIRSVIPEGAHTAAILGTEREGNGVIIDSEGTILTIGYLIIEAETLEVSGQDGNPVSATFLGYDHQSGFGLLRADKPLGVTPMKLGQSSTVKEGDPILVAGHGGPDAVITARVISRKEFAGYWEYLLDDAIYTAPAYANYGGAALINSEGHLMGIGSLLTQFSIPGLGSLPSNVFVPIDLLHPILSELKTEGRPRKAPRPWLGINVEEAHGRVFITRITSGGPSEKGGLQRGDLIVAVNGKAVKGLADFYRKVWALGNAGVEVKLSLLRETEIRDIVVRSGDRHRFLLIKPKKVL